MSRGNQHHARMTTPTTEPAIIVAGDTISWLRSLAAYPATSGWVLKYRLLNASAKIEITSVASGADHLVQIPAATSKDYAAGTYDWTAWVEAGDERHTVAAGRIIVKPNLATLNTYDGRSDARKSLEALQAAYQAYITGGNAHVAEYEIAGRRMKFHSAMEILNQIEYWQNQVNAEERRERIASGQKPKNKIRVRF